MLRSEPLPRLSLVVLITVNLVIGLVTFRHYGVSWDEPGIYSFADESLNAYARFLRPVEYTDPRSNWDLRYYGPFYFIFAGLMTRCAQTLGLPVSQPDLWHLLYFLTFQAGVGVFYLLSRRWLTEWAALGATVLFASQPLLWGHAFINPKDIPFMVFFLAAFYTGLVMTDRLTQLSPLPIPMVRLTGLIRQGREEWQQVIPQTRRLTTTQAGISLGLIVGVLAPTAVWQNLLAGFLRVTYNANTNPLGRLFWAMVSPTAHVPVENYITKLSIWLLRLEGLTAILLAGLALWLFLRQIPATTEMLRQWLFRPLQELSASLRNPAVLLTGLLLGFTSSIRLLGPLIGLIVAILLFYRLRARAWAPILTYAGIAILSMYATWPFLWGHPVKRFLDSLGRMSNFPINTNVLFAGQYYPAHQLPRSYLPVLFSIQLTESAVILFFCGLVIFFWRCKNFLKPDLLAFLIGGWLFPLSTLIIGQNTLYDNFRQVLFLIPPLFIISGFAIDQFFQTIRPLYFRLPIIIALGLCGWVPMLQLHPYEYVYYNQFVGGLAGASKNYYLDYWAISFRADADYLNQVAPANARILVCGPAEALRYSLRPDLSVTEGCKASEPQTGYAYVVIQNRNSGLDFYQDAPTHYSAERQGITFSVVKALVSKSQP